MFLRIGVLGIMSLMLISCSFISSHTSFIQNREKEYLTAKSIPALRVPPGINSDAFHGEYTVSDRTYPPLPNKISTTPPGLYDK